MLLHSLGEISKKKSEIDREIVSILKFVNDENVTKWKIQINKNEKYENAM